MIRSKRVAEGSSAIRFGRIIRPNVGPAVAGPPAELDGPS